MLKDLLRKTSHLQLNYGRQIRFKMEMTILKGHELTAFRLNALEILIATISYESYILTNKNDEINSVALYNMALASTMLGPQASCSAVRPWPFGVTPLGGGLSLVTGFGVDPVHNLSLLRRCRYISFVPRLRWSPKAINSQG